MISVNNGDYNRDYIINEDQIENQILNREEVFSFPNIDSSLLIETQAKIELKKKHKKIHKNTIKLINEKYPNISREDRNNLMKGNKYKYLYLLHNCGEVSDNPCEDILYYMNKYKISHRIAYCLLLFSDEQCEFIDIEHISEEIINKIKEEFNKNDNNDEGIFTDDDIEKIIIKHYYSLGEINEIDSVNSSIFSLKNAIYNLLEEKGLSIKYKIKKETLLIFRDFLKQVKSGGSFYLSFFLSFYLRDLIDIIILEHPIATEKDITTFEVKRAIEIYQDINPHHNLNIRNLVSLLNTTYDQLIELKKKMKETYGYDIFIINDEIIKDIDQKNIPLEEAILSFQKKKIIQNIKETIQDKSDNLLKEIYNNLEIEKETGKNKEYFQKIVLEQLTLKEFTLKRIRDFYGLVKAYDTIFSKQEENRETANFFSRITNNYFNNYGDQDIKKNIIIEARRLLKGIEIKKIRITLIPLVIVIS